jgi:hypothetical protein
MIQGNNIAAGDRNPRVRLSRQHAAAGRRPIVQSSAAGRFRLDPPAFSDVIAAALIPFID